MKLKPILLLSLCLSIGTVLYADTAKINGIRYSFSGNEASVTYMSSNPNIQGDYNYEENYSGAIVIPESVTYNDMVYRVTSIGKGAFYNCTDLTSVTIPNSVTTIGYCAFESCI